MKFLSKLTLMMFPFVCHAKSAPNSNFELIQEFLPRLAAIESSGNPNAVGDSGKSLGMYQISKEAWRDGTDWIRLNIPEYLTVFFEPLGKDYKKECMDEEKSKWIATFYLMYLADRMQKNKHPVTKKSLYMAYNCGYSKASSFNFDMNHFAISDKRRAIFIRAATIIDADLTTPPRKK
jgi:hypothetical protein